MLSLSVCHGNADVCLLSEQKSCSSPALLRCDTWATLSQPQQECYTSLNGEICVDTQLPAVQSLRLFLCSQEVPYLLSNSWMVHVPNRCLACICLEVMELLMEAIPWDKGFFRFAYPAWSLALYLSLSSRVLQLSALYLQRETRPSCFRWETCCLSPLTMEKAYTVKLLSSGICVLAAQCSVRLTHLE